MAQQSKSEARSRQSSSLEPTKADYERLGRLLHSVAEMGVADHAKLYRLTFFKGIIGGLGGVIGATIVVALLLWIFSLLGNVPLLGPIIEIITQKVQSY